GPQVRWEFLAADPHGTIVGYMGVTQLEGVVRELLGSGLDPKTPAAVVERGTTSSQRVVRAAIADLPRAALQARVRPPALFIIGPTVRHAEQLEWFSRRPLFGERLLVPAPAGPLGEALELAGADVVEAPLPVTPAARAVLAALPLSGCVLRSADEVESLDEERDGPRWDAGVAAWCLGAGAAQAARRRGWRLVEELPAQATAAEVAAAIRKKHP
ncbi:MAG: hypothetical protein HY812_18710, partial [Planctomycetes bacterium]|nr:hypothetical protein [Planctomycetota bacterium]